MKPIVLFKVLVRGVMWNRGVRLSEYMLLRLLPIDG